MDPLAAYGPLVAELETLLPAGTIVVDAHTHLGRDEDGQSLDPDALIPFLDEVGPSARAVHIRPARPRARPELPGSQRSGFAMGTGV